jgi:hypothetical protein
MRRAAPVRPQQMRRPHFRLTHVADSNCSPAYNNPHTFEAAVLTDYFEYIYVINLAERADRRGQMQAQLEKFGLSLVSDNVLLFPASRPTSAGDFPSIGAHGCFLSHVGVIEDAIARNAKSILILEDDCDFTEAPAVQIALQGLRALASEPGIFYGGFTAQTQPNHFIVDGLLAIAEPSCPLGQAHCIGFKGDILPKLHTYLRSMYARPPGDALGGPMHVDGAYCWFRRENVALRTVCCIPNIAFQRPSHSDIASSGRLARTLIGRTIIEFYRIIKRSLKLHLS